MLSFYGAKLAISGGFALDNLEIVQETGERAAAIEKNIKRSSGAGVSLAKRNIKLDKLNCELWSLTKRFWVGSCWLELPTWKILASIRWEVPEHETFTKRSFS